MRERNNIAHTKRTNKTIKKRKLKKGYGNARMRYVVTCMITRLQ